MRLIGLTRTTAAAALAVAVLAAALPVAASASPAGDGGNTIGPGGRVAASGLSVEVVTALRRDLGLTADQVTKLAARQAKAAEVDRTLRARLGNGFAGSWYDTKSGTLVVNVTDPGVVPRVTAAGARARVVKHSRARLERIKAELDALAGGTTGSATRAVSGNRRPAALAGLTGWHVDPKTDSVVVTAVKPQLSTAARTKLAGYGDAVRVEYVDHAPQPAANFMDGGDEINGATCSAGFNLRNPATGQGYLLTAGHCVSTGSTLTGQGGVPFGPVLESWFPTYDDAIVRNDNPGYWIQGPWVDIDPSNGPVTIINGFTDGPVGTIVCKSGITTKLTCGEITAMRVAVTYVGGLTVFGLTQHSACVEPGDSGGGTFAVTASGYTAEGVTSGAMLYGPTRRCGQAVGLPNTSWYYPVAASLDYYGPRYGVALW